MAIRKPATDEIMGSVAFAMTEFGTDFAHFLARPLTTISFAIANLESHFTKPKFAKIQKNYLLLNAIFREWHQAVLKASDYKFPTKLAEIPPEKLMAVKIEIGRLTSECIQKMAPELQKLKRNISTAKNLKATRNLKKVKTGIEQLSGIVSTYTKMKDSFGKAHQLTNVNQIVREVLEFSKTFRTRQRSSTNKRIQIEVRTKLGRNLPETQVNPLTLMNAITNAVSNATKAMGDQGEITIRTHAKGKHVHVEIRDNGPGIPPAKRKDVLQYGVSTRKGQGNFPQDMNPRWGTGLALSKTMVSAEGGRVSVKSRVKGPNKGTTVLFKLPRKHHTIR